MNPPPETGGDGLDPELKAYLDTMRRAIVDDLRQDMATRADLDTFATRADLEKLGADMLKMDRENRILHEETQRQLRAAEEGRQTVLEHIDRRFDEHDRKWDERVQQVEAVVSVNSNDIRAIRHDVAAIRSDVSDLRRVGVDHESRIQALERRQPAR